MLIADAVVVFAVLFYFQYRCLKCNSINGTVAEKEKEEELKSGCVRRR